MRRTAVGAMKGGSGPTWKPVRRAEMWSSALRARQSALAALQSGQRLASRRRPPTKGWT